VADRWRRATGTSAEKCPNIVVSFTTVTEHSDRNIWAGGSTSDVLNMDWNSLLHFPDEGPNVVEAFASFSATPYPNS